MSVDLTRSHLWVFAVLFPLNLAALLIWAPVHSAFARLGWFGWLLLFDASVGSAGLTALLIVPLMRVVFEKR